MASLTIKKQEQASGFLGLEDANYYNLSIDFTDKSRLEFVFSVRKQSRDPGYWEEDKHFVNTPSEFISALHRGRKAAFGIIWHDYCADAPIRTKDGRLFLHLCDVSGPTLQLSSELGDQLIAELEKLGL